MLHANRFSLQVHPCCSKQDIDSAKYISSMKLTRIVKGSHYYDVKLSNKGREVRLLMDFDFVIYRTPGSKKSPLLIFGSNK